MFKKDNLILIALIILIVFSSMSAYCLYSHNKHEQFFLYGALIGLICVIYLETLNKNKS